MNNEYIQLLSSFCFGPDSLYHGVQVCSRKTFLAVDVN